MTRLRADLALLLVALIWGAAFVSQKLANDSMGPLSFVGARFVVSWIAIAPLAFLEHRSATRAPIGEDDFRLAGFLGLCLFVGSCLQQVGLLTTTATNGGFLTALYVILVPIVLWIMSGVPPRLVVATAGVMSIVGAWLLTQKGEMQHLTSGDVLILLSDVAWAVWICVVPRFLMRTDRPFYLAFVQFGVAAILGVIVGLSFETVSRAGLNTALPAILYAGLCSGGIAYTLQIFAQKHTPPAEAALIMSLESVFAAIAGALWLSERLTQLAVLGCAFIFLGVLLVEVGPLLQNARTIGSQNPRKAN